MVNSSRILKLLTWYGFDEFDWIDSFMKTNVASLSLMEQIVVRGSHRRCSIKKAVLGDFANFTGKHLCQSLIFNVVGLRPTTLLKKRLWHRCFPVNLAKFLRASFFTKHRQWLLLCSKCMARFLLHLENFWFRHKPNWETASCVKVLLPKFRIWLIFKSFINYSINMMDLYGFINGMILLIYIYIYIYIHTYTHTWVRPLINPSYLSNNF